MTPVVKFPLTPPKSTTRLLVSRWIRGLPLTLPIRSCRKACTSSPSIVRRRLRRLPPSRSSFSTRYTSKACSARCRAAVMPATPPPMTRARCTTGTAVSPRDRFNRALATAMRTSCFAFCGGLRLLAHVHPGTLVADVGHLEQELVQARFPDRLAEHGLVRAGRTGGHDHAVQAVLLDGLFDLFLGILRAGVEIFVGVDDIRQRARVLLDGGDVHHPADIDAAVADEDADPGLLLRFHLGLRRVFLLGGQRSPRRGDHPRGGGGGAACLGDRLGDVLRRLKGAADIDPFPRCGKGG